MDWLTFLNGILFCYLIVSKLVVPNIKEGLKYEEELKNGEFFD